MSKGKLQKIVSLVVKQLANLNPPSEKDIRQTLFHPAHIISQILETELVALQN